MLRLGIVGCGRVTNLFHLKAIEDVEGVEVAAVSDRNPGRMETAKARSGARRGYVDYSDLLTDPDVDAVVVNTPPHLHEEMVIHALKAGKHVLCEKPLARSVESCLNIKRLQGETGLVVLPAHNYVFTPCLTAVRELVKEGVIGEVSKLSVSFENNLRRYGSKGDFRLRTEFGIVEDLLPHVLSVINGLAGTAAAVEDARGWKKSSDVMDNMRLLLETDEGVEVDCFMSWTGMIPRFKLAVHGTEGRISADLIRSPFQATLESGGAKTRIGESGGLRMYLDLLRLRHPSFRNQYRHLQGLVERSEKSRITVDDE
ncbi:MAG: Gfo/Idh/MocA family protein, partial [Candidatus Bathyarchaeia archaeon]